MYRAYDIQSNTLDWNNLVIWEFAVMEILLSKNPASILFFPIWEQRVLKISFIIELLNIYKVMFVSVPAMFDKTNIAVY